MYVWGDFPPYVLCRQSPALFALASIYYAVVRQFSSNGSTSKATAPLTPHRSAHPLHPSRARASHPILRKPIVGPRDTRRFTVVDIDFDFIYVCTSFTSVDIGLELPVSTCDTFSFFREDSPGDYYVVMFANYPITNINCNYLFIPILF